MNRSGFTLMEILAVLLILALVITFAMPGIRFVRDEVRHSQAKAAAVKMAEAMRSYYTNTRGVRVIGSTDADVIAAAVCNAPNGVPTVTVGSASVGNIANNADELSNLFGCNYLAAKDFRGLPYTFSASNGLFDQNILVRATGTTNAGRHQDHGWNVYRDGSVAEF